MTDKSKLQNAAKDELNHEKKDERDDVDMITEETETQENSNERIEDDQVIDFQMEQELTNRY